MDLWDRLLYLVIGGFFGFVTGYIVRDFRFMKEKVKHVDDTVTEINSKWNRDDGGFMRYPIIADVALLFVLFLTVFASFQSQEASNQVAATQDRVAAVTHCNKVYLTEVLKSVNARTHSSQKQINANVQLQKVWYEFVVYQLHVPPYPIKAQRLKANAYAESLKAFLNVSEENVKNIKQYPYPKASELDRCIEQGVN